MTVPHLNPATSLVESTNTQFQYEAQEKLTEQLEREYGQVGEYGLGRSWPVVRAGEELACGAGWGRSWPVVRVGGGVGLWCGLGKSWPVVQAGEELARGAGWGGVGPWCGLGRSWPVVWAGEELACGAGWR